MSADTNPDGWPDPTKPGTPLNPDRAGWHWLQWPLSGLKMMLWKVEDGDAWWSIPGELEADDTMRAVQLPRWGVTYLGPCLTPSDLAAREAAAWCAGRDAAVAAVTAKEKSYTEDPWDSGFNVALYAAEEAIHALPLPADAQAALDAVVREAVMREREACLADIANERLSDQPDNDSDHAYNTALEHAVAAIRARGEAE